MINKKAILVLRTIVIIILTIFIFIPVITCTVKYCQYSVQAKNNFGDFVEKIKNFVESGEVSDEFMLIMDSETAIVGLSEGQKTVESCYTVGNQEYCAIWVISSDECKEGGCICLLRDFKLEAYSKKIEPETITCKQTGGLVFDTPHHIKKIKTESVTSTDYGKGESTFFYFTKGGFVLGNAIKSEVKGVPLYVGRYMIEEFNFKARRNLIHLMNKEGKIFVCWEENCKDVAETVEKE